MFELFNIYWCSSTDDELKKLFLRKEKIISHILSFETISKLHFDFYLLKLLYSKNCFNHKTDKMYEQILGDSDRIYSLREYLYNNKSNAIEGKFYSSEINEKIDYFFK